MLRIHPMPTTLSQDTLSTLRTTLTRANAERVQGPRPDMLRRQPVHTVYGGAHLFQADTAKKLGELALRSLERYAPKPDVLAKAMGFPEALAERVHERVVAKLRR